MITNRLSGWYVYTNLHLSVQCHYQLSIVRGHYYFPLVPTDCLIVSDLTIASHRSTTEPTTDTVTVEINWAGPSDPACSHLTNLTVMATQSPPYPEERRRPSVFVCATLPGNETQFVIEQGLPYAEYTAILFAFNASSGESGAVMTETHRSLATGENAGREMYNFYVHDTILG